MLGRRVLSAFRDLQCNLVILILALSACVDTSAPAPSFLLTTLPQFRVELPSSLGVASLTDDCTLTVKGLRWDAGEVVLTALSPSIPLSHTTLTSTKQQQPTQPIHSYSLHYDITSHSWTIETSLSLLSSSNNKVNDKLTSPQIPLCYTDDDAMKSSAEESVGSGSIVSMNVAVWCERCLIGGRTIVVNTLVATIDGDDDGLVDTSLPTFVIVLKDTDLSDDSHQTASNNKQQQQQQRATQPTPTTNNINTIITAGSNTITTTHNLLKHYTRTLQQQQQQPSSLQQPCSPITIAGTTHTFSQCVQLSQLLNLPLPYEIQYDVVPSPSNDGATVLKGAIRAKPVDLVNPTWVGWGFPALPSRGMLGSQAIVVHPDTSSPTGASVDGYILRDYTPEAVNAARGQFPLTNTSAEQLPDGTLVAVFTANLNKDQYTTLITTPRPVIYACGVVRKDNTLLPHIVTNQNQHPYGQATLAFQPKGSTSSSGGGVEATGSAGNKQFIRAHAWLMGIGWGVLIPLGAVFAHCFKEYDPLWFQIHRALQFTGLLCGYVGLGMIFVFTSQKYDGVPGFSAWNIQYTKHRNIGIAVMAMGLVQLTALFWRPHKGTKLRPFWHVLHGCVGCAAIGLAIYNIWYGMYKVSIADTQDWTRILYWSVLGCIGGMGVLKEVYNWTVLRGKKNKENDVEEGGSSVNGAITKTI